MGSDRIVPTGNSQRQPAKRQREQDNQGELAFVLRELANHRDPLLISCASTDRRLFPTAARSAAVKHLNSREIPDRGNNPGCDRTRGLNARAIDCGRN